MKQQKRRPVFQKLPYIAGILWGLFCLSWLLRFFFPSNVPYKFLHPTDQITKVQIARVTKDLDLYQHSVSEICAMLDDTTFTISTVKQENLGVFLERFSQIPCRQWVNDPNPHLRGKVLLVTYQDGSREWICADGTFYWNTDSSKASITRHYFDKESFSNLLAVCQQLT